MNNAHILELVAFNANLQLAHWQADTLGNTHRVLGELYDSLTDLTDKLAEVAMGKSSRIDFEPVSVQLTPKANLKELFAEGFKIIFSIRSELKIGEDDDLLNILADFSEELNRAKYLLKI